MHGRTWRCQPVHGAGARMAWEQRGRCGEQQMSRCEIETREPGKRAGPCSGHMYFLPGLTAEAALGDHSGRVKWTAQLSSWN